MNLKFVGSENARPGLGNPGFESRRVALQLGHLFTTFGLLGVMFGHTVLPQADEGNPLLQQVGVGRLASSGALGHGLLGDADLSGPLDNGVLQDGAFTLLSPQRLGNLSKKNCLECNERWWEIFPNQTFYHSKGINIFHGFYQR